MFCALNDRSGIFSNNIKTQSKSKLKRVTEKVHAICPCVLTIGMPKLRHECHFWWSLWVFLREDQMRFEIASLTTVKKKKLNLAHRSAQCAKVNFSRNDRSASSPYHVLTTRLTLRNKLTRMFLGVLLSSVPI